MKIHLIVICVGILAIAACSRQKKQSLESIDNEDAIEKYAGDTLSNQKGIRYTQSRAIDRNDPPIVLDISGKCEIKDLNLSDYYSKVKYVKLKHPEAESGKQFFIKEGMIFISNVFTSINLDLSVKITDNYILVGDALYGLHCYDKLGNFVYTITSMENPPKYHKTGMRIDLLDVKNFMSNYYILGDICMFTTVDKGKTSLNFHNLSSRKTEYKKMYAVHKALPLNAENKNFIDYCYNVEDKAHKPFIYSFNSNGDTLCQFINYNDIPVIKTTYHNPGPGNIYYYDNQLSIRQVGNDTLFRFVSEKRLNPAYIIHAGKYKANMENITKEKNGNKRLPGHLLETKDFLLFSYDEYSSDDYKSNQPHCCFLDKSTQRFYQTPDKKKTDIIMISNSLRDGIPFLLDKTEFNGKSIYTYYSRNMLKAMIEDP